MRRTFIGVFWLFSRLHELERDKNMWPLTAVHLASLRARCRYLVPRLLLGDRHGRGAWRQATLSAPILIYWHLDVRTAPGAQSLHLDLVNDGLMRRSDWVSSSPPHGSPGTTPAVPRLTLVVIILGVVLAA